MERIGAKSSHMVQYAPGSAAILLGARKKKNLLSACVCERICSKGVFLLLYEAGIGKCSSQLSHSAR